MKLWYSRPGESFFNRTLPIGGGIVGAMLFGNPAGERVALNHAWLWRDLKTKGRENPECAHWLPQIRKLFFEGKMEEAGNLAKNILGTQASSGAPFFEPAITQKIYGPDPFVPVGDLWVEFPSHEEYTGYRAELDLTTSEARVSYTSGGIEYSRRAIASRANDLVMMRLEAGKPGALNCTLRLERIEDAECTLECGSAGNALTMKGTFFEGKTFAAAVSAAAVNGSVRMENGKCTVVGADALELAVAVSTDHESPDPVGRCMEMLKPASQGYDKLREEAVREYAELFSRVTFEIGGEDRSGLPTDERLARFAAGEEDCGIQNILLQAGRYMDIAYSKKGGVPGNLHGIWSEQLYPSWNCDLHHDINSQGMYWSIDPLNIPETGDVLFDYLESLIPEARIAARKLYGCRGIYIPLSTSCWPKCLKLEPGWDEFTGAAIWFCEHYWWRWDFYRDMDFLRDRAYPFLKEVGLFYLDYLVPDPRRDHRFFGKLQAVPSYSPENAFIGGNRPVSLSITCTFELELLYELFARLVKASETLGVDEDLRAEYRRVLENLPPLQIGKYGQLQEWLEDYPENDGDVGSGTYNSSEGVGHRHLSPMLGVYPGELITPRRTPELAEAAYVFSRRRIERGAARGGWAGWSAVILARLGRAEEAQERIRLYFADQKKLYISPGISPGGGLYNGIVSSEVEMVLQSHEQDIHLLPALPGEWKSGRASGLMARGGFEVGLEWRDGALRQARITSRLGEPCIVTCAGKSLAFSTEKGGVYNIGADMKIMG